MAWIEIEGSRRSRSFEKDERLWQKDLNRLTKMIGEHVASLGKFKTKKDRSKFDAAPTLSLAIFGPAGSGKSSLLKTLIYEAQKEEKKDGSDLKKVASLDLLQPARFGPGDHLLYATVAASLDAHHQQQGKNYDYEVLTPVLKSYRELSDHLRVIRAEDFGNDLEPHALAAEVVQRHTSGLRIKGKLNTFFNDLADNLTNQPDDSVVLLPVDDLDLNPDHLLAGLRELQAYLLHPRLIPVFCFTDRLAEEILTDSFAKIVSHADSQRGLVGRLSVSEQLGVQYLSKCFPIRNRIRLGPSHAVLQNSDITTQEGQGSLNEPVLLTLGAVSVLLFGVKDRNRRHPVVAALRPSTLRRQFHILDAMRQVGVDCLINENISNLVLPGKALLSQKDSENRVWSPKRIEEHWGVLFDRAAWTLFNIHRDILRENGMFLEDLYTWTPHALRRVILEALFHLSPNSQVGLWQRWRSLTDSRRSQVISLLAVNTYRPWLVGEPPSGEDHHQIMNDRKQPSEQAKEMSITTPVALLWFLDLAVSFYLPFGRSVFRQLRSSRKDSEETTREPLSGAGWSLHSAPIHAAITADDDRKPFPTGMMFLDSVSYATALTTSPRIAACRMLDNATPRGRIDMQFIKDVKLAFLGTPTNEIIDDKDHLEDIVNKYEPYRKENPHFHLDFSDILKETKKKYKAVAVWESGKDWCPPDGNSDSLSSAKDLRKALENHDYSRANGIIDRSNFSDKQSLKKSVHGLFTAATALHDDQLLLRIWTCYGFNRGRFWVAASLWRGLGLMGQLIESYRRWKEEASHEQNGGADIVEKITGVLHTHSLRGLVPGKDLGDLSGRGTLDLAFTSWNTKDQRQAIRRLATRLASWLENSEEHKIFPYDESGKSWGACFIRRLHGDSMVGALWQWLDAEFLEHQGRQYGKRRHYFWNAGVAITSWLRVLQRYFERAHSIRWLLETCPLTGPFLSRAKNDPFLAKLSSMSYHELLKVTEEYGKDSFLAEEGAASGGGRKQFGDGCVGQMRVAKRFRAITDGLEKLWEGKVDYEKLSQMANCEYKESDLKHRSDWLALTRLILENLINLDQIEKSKEVDPGPLDQDGVNTPSQEGQQSWRELFSENEYDEVVKIAGLVREVVWKEDQSDSVEDSNSKRYLDSLLNSFNPKIEKRISENEDEDIVYPESACFEIVSMIQQHWKVCAHASAASLFYQIPRVNRSDFLNRAPRQKNHRPTRDKMSENKNNPTEHRDNEDGQEAGFEQE